MQKRIISATALLAAALIAAGVWAGLQIKQNIQNGLISNYALQEQTIGTQVSSTLSGQMENIQNSLRALAINPNIRTNDSTACQAALKEATSKVQLGLGNLGRVNANGTFVCSLNTKLIGSQASALGPYVQQLIDDPQHKPVVSRQIKVPGVDGYVIATHVPVYDASGNFSGTIGGALYLNDLAKDYLDKIKFADTGYASLLDDNGDILYSHVPTNTGKNYFEIQAATNNGGLKELTKAVNRAKVGQTSQVRYTTTDGIDKVASVVSVPVTPGHNWIVIVNVPVSEVSTVFLNAGLDRAFELLLAIFIITVLFITTLLILTTARAAKLQRAEDQFVTIISHQLRTPLTSIRLFSEMLTRGQQGKLNPAQKEYVANIHDSTERMIKLVGEILNVSRIALDRIRVAPELADLKELVANNVDSVRPLAKQQNITIQADLPAKRVMVPIDILLTDQIVHNLITNAMRYSKEKGGVVKISLTRSGKQHIISIQDNGIGIPKYAQKRIFKQFYRADNAIESVGEGSGLGLYLVKMLCDITGCKVDFVSREGRGTKFTVAVPLQGMKPRNNTGEGNVQSS
jgi:signal transduction histidine kinase